MHWMFIQNVLITFFYLFQVFWAIGACFEVLLALVVMPTLGWQYLLGFSALPLLLFAIGCVVSYI